MELLKRYSALTALVAVALILVAGEATASTDLLGKYESGDRAFREGVFGDKVVYYHQRMIGDASVEKDNIIYQFDRETGELLEKRVNWRDDLPEELPADLILREDAESAAGGDVQFSRLYYISPESVVFPVEPTPDDPCWIVRTIVDGRLSVKIVNAVTGELLGDGVPPPTQGFSFTGPWECPYYGAWTSWYVNAANWFETMGYPTEGVKWPTLEQIRGHVKSDHTAMFYELNHGGSASFMYGCDTTGAGMDIGSFKVAMWISNRAKMPFTFLGSCEGMCDTLGSSFSASFRKNSWEATTTVGYCHMAEPWCADCWGESIMWQTALFDYMNQGYSVRDAFVLANSDVPPCGLNDCMRFAGDPSFAVVPVVARDPISPDVTLASPNGGELLEYNTDHEITWTASDNARVTGVTVVLSPDGGVTYPDTIAKDEANDGSYMWTIPDTDSKTARVKVVAFDGVPNEGSDASDSDFTLWGSTSGVARDDLTGVPDRAVLVVAGGSVLTSSTSIVFGLPSAADVRMAVYDVAGRHLRDLVNGRREEGYHTLGWNATGPVAGTLSSGMYFIRLDTGAEILTTKVVIAR
jgi:hypothetical protein